MCSPNSSATWCRSRSLCTRHRQVAEERIVRTACRTRASSCRSSCHEGAADRRGRLHRSAGGCGARGAGHDVVAVDAMLPAAHGPAASPAGVQGRLRDAAAVARCSTGSTWCVTRRRWWARGWTPATRRLWQPQRLRDGGAAGGDVRRGLSAAGAGLVDGGVRAGPLRLSRTRLVEPLPRRALIWTPGFSSTAARSAANSWSGGWSTRTRRCGRAACMRRARSRRSTTRSRGAEPGGARWSRCDITTSTGRTCRATPRTPGWPRSSAPRSSTAARQGFRGRRSDARLRPRRRHRRREHRGHCQTLLARGFHAGQRVLRAAGLDSLRWPTEL